MFFLHLFIAETEDSKLHNLSRQLEEALRRLDARVERAAGTALQCSEGALGLAETDVDHRWWKRDSVDVLFHFSIWLVD